MTALVTGASSGIGDQIARQLARRGVDLVVAARGEERLEALAAEVRADNPGVRVAVRVVDLSGREAPDELAQSLRSDGLDVDLLVNNAGFGTYDRFVDQDPERIAGQLQVNCAALVALTARFLPGMLDRRRGGVVNVASTAAFQPTPNMAVYGASKAFVLSFTEALWAETRGTGVTVVAVCPGPTETPFFEKAGNGKRFLTRGRQTPEQVAAVALRALHSGRGPSVISGGANRLLAVGPRLLPRGAMARLSAQILQSART